MVASIVCKKNGPRPEGCKHAKGERDLRFYLRDPRVPSLSSNPFPFFFLQIAWLSPLSLRPRRSLVPSILLELFS